MIGIAQDSTRLVEEITVADYIRVLKAITCATGKCTLCTGFLMMMASTAQLDNSGAYNSRPTESRHPPYPLHRTHRWPLLAPIMHLDVTNDR